MSEPATDHVADIELLTTWEGPVEHAPGVLFEESSGAGRDVMSGEGSLSELAAWVAVAALSGVSGNAASDAIKSKVLGVLEAFRQRKGQAQLEALKEQVFKEMQKHRANGKLSEQELEARINNFFAPLEG